MLSEQQRFVKAEYLQKEFTNNVDMKVLLTKIIF